MATKIFLLDAASDYQTGVKDPLLTGAAGSWLGKSLGLAAGSTATATTTGTVAGPTVGIEVNASGSPPANYWLSPPLATAVTIAGSITWNIWGRENSASANVAINGRLEVVDGATGAITLIDQTARTTELAVSTTTFSVNNFAETPVAGVVCKKGDRLRVRIFGDDAGTMATGFTFDINYNGPTAAATGDTWLQITETVTFATEPAGSQVFPTDTASPVSTAAITREAWTSRGAGVQTDVTNTVAGPTVPIQMTDTAGGTAVEWYTRPLTAFTLGGAVRANVRTAGSSFSSVHRVEVAVVNGDGSGAVVWAAGSWPGATSASENARSHLISGTDVAVTNGQRLRIRFYIDDYITGSMSAGAANTLWYAGTSGGASGDTFLTFSQSLTEYVAPVTFQPYVQPYPPLLAQ
jgi:hypothetical protein